MPSIPNSGEHLFNESFRASILLTAFQRGSDGGATPRIYCSGTLAINLFPEDVGSNLSRLRRLYMRSPVVKKVGNPFRYAAKYAAISHSPVVIPQTQNRPGRKIS